MTVMQLGIDPSCPADYQISCMKRTGYAPMDFYALGDHHPFDVSGLTDHNFSTEQITPYSTLEQQLVASDNLDLIPLDPQRRSDNGYFRCCMLRWRRNTPAISRSRERG